jgi:hypothetical protein
LKAKGRFIIRIGDWRIAQSGIPGVGALRPSGT